MQAKEEREIAADSPESMLEEYLGTGSIDYNPLDSTERSVPLTLLTPSRIENLGDDYQDTTASDSPGSRRSVSSCLPDNATPFNSQASEESTTFEQENTWLTWGLFHCEPTLKNASMFLLLVGGSAIVLGGALGLVGMAGVAAVAIKSGMIAGGVGALLGLYGFCSKNEQDKSADNISAEKLKTAGL